MRREMIVDRVTGCARCGGEHESIEFHRFTKFPVVGQDGETWDFWGTCPATDEPILAHDPNEWSKKFPSFGGWYWFYGTIERNGEESDPDVFPAFIWQPGKVVYIAEPILGEMPRSISELRGVWKPLKLPETPGMTNRE